MVWRMIGLLGLLVLPAGAGHASYGIYVGRELTADGSVLVGGTGDEVSSHWLEIVPRRRHAPGSTIRVGVDGRAIYPGEFIEIPQVAETARFLTMNYSDFEGFPPPLTNGGLNEHGVAARDIWSPSRPELAAMTPNPQRGPNYSDLSRIVMERARSAREAVEIVGELIDRHGFSTYGGNSHLFADAREGWVVVNFAGGQGLWIAERLGPDEARRRVCDRRVRCRTYRSGDADGVEQRLRCDANERVRDGGLVLSITALLLSHGVSASRHGGALQRDGGRVSQVYNYEFN